MTTPSAPDPSPPPPPPPPPSPRPSAPLDYRAAESDAESGGCLTVAIMFAVLCGLGTLFGMLFMPGFTVGLVALGAAVLIGGGIFATKRWGVKRATAIVLVALCVFLLMFGLCAGVGTTLGGM